MIYRDKDSNIRVALRPIEGAPPQPRLPGKICESGIRSANQHDSALALYWGLIRDTWRFARAQYRVIRARNALRTVFKAPDQFEPTIKLSIATANEEYFMKLGKMDDYVRIPLKPI